jgi:hypothetical protein
MNHVSVEVGLPDRRRSMGFSASTTMIKQVN